MPIRHTFWHSLILGAAATLFVLTLLLLDEIAFGAPVVPPFPFQNIQQFGGTPDWELAGAGYAGGHCKEFEAMKFTFTLPGQDIYHTLQGWQVWISGTTQDVSAVYYVRTDEGMQRFAVYFGTISRENGHLTITESALFDHEKHGDDPCAHWK